VWWQAIPIYAAIGVTALASYYILAGANRMRGVLGEIGIRVLMRLMGLVLVAIAVQFVLNALQDLGVIPGRR
jgi:multiple antibiotic resistance protein